MAARAGRRAESGTSLPGVAFGSTLHPHLHFHCAVIEGVFEPAAGGVVFHAATGLDATAITQVQAQVRRRMLRVFVRRSLLPGDDAQAMGQWEHGGGFSVDGSVRIEAADRAGGESLLRYCARPPFALNRLHELDLQRLLCDVTKPGLGGNGPLLLTPLQLLDRLAALVPPSRIATVTSACRRERPVTGNFHGDTDRRLVAYSVEILATRRLDKKSTAQNGSGSTIVTRLMVRGPRKVHHQMLPGSFSTE